MDKVITTRLPKEFILGLKKIAEKENLDFSTVIRKLLARAMNEWKIDYVLEKLDNHNISIGMAAHECGISIWEMMDLARRKNIDWTGYDEEELKNDLNTLKI